MGKMKIFKQWKRDCQFLVKVVSTQLLKKSQKKALKIKNKQNLMNFELYQQQQLFDLDDVSVSCDFDNISVTSLEEISFIFYSLEEEIMDAEFYSNSTLETPPQSDDEISYSSTETMSQDDEMFWNDEIL